MLPRVLGSANLFGRGYREKRVGKRQASAQMQAPKSANLFGRGYREKRVGKRQTSAQMQAPKSANLFCRSGEGRGAVARVQRCVSFGMRNLP